MMISPHFRRSEALCRCGKCGLDSADIILVRMLEDIRLHFGRPIIVTSWNRCIEYNKAIGGAENSWHTKGGRAVDFYINHIHPQDIYEYIDIHHPICGLGLYNDWVHLDSRGTKARW